jgi:hypothetical protein
MVKRVENQLITNQDDLINSASGNSIQGSSLSRDITHIPIVVSVYCKECKKTISPDQIMSDETWKMSFGKFMEICLYNRSAVGRLGDCTHRVQYAHTLVCTCDIYEARLDVSPIEPFSIHIRESLESSKTFFEKQAAQYLAQLANIVIEISEKFLTSVAFLDKACNSLLATSPENLSLLLGDLKLLEVEIITSTVLVVDEVIKTLERLSPTITIGLPSIIVPPRFQNGTGKTNFSHWYPPVANAVATIVPAETAKLVASDATSTDSSERRPGDSSIKQSESKDNPGKVATPIIDAMVNSTALSDGQEWLRNPMMLKRVAFLKAKSWNSHLEDVYTFIDQTRAAAAAILQQQLQARGAGVQFVVTSTTPAMTPIPMTSNASIEDEISSGIEPSFDSSGSPMPSSNRMKSTIHRQISADTDNSDYDRDSRPSIVPIPFGTHKPVSDAEKRKSGRSRFAKALAQLVMGKEAGDDTKIKDVVELGQLGEGRLGMIQGRKGEVLAVNTDDAASIIAYSLATESYYSQLQSFYRTDIDSEIVDGIPDDDTRSEAEGITARISGKEGLKSEVLDELEAESNSTHAGMSSVITSDTTPVATRPETSKRRPNFLLNPFGESSVNNRNTSNEAVKQALEQEEVNNTLEEEFAAFSFDDEASKAKVVSDVNSTALPDAVPTKSETESYQLMADADGSADAVDESLTSSDSKIPTIEVSHVDVISPDSRNRSDPSLEVTDDDNKNASAGSTKTAKLTSKALNSRERQMLSQSTCVLLL